jgi:DNA binding domain, excisionase family
MNAKTQNVLTVKEISEMLRIGSNGAYALIHSKAFPVVRIGHTYRIPEDSFFTWLKRQEQPAATWQ